MTTREQRDEYLRVQAAERERIAYVQLEKRLAKLEREAQELSKMLADLVNSKGK